MKSGSENLKIMVLFVMCCWQVQILGKNIYKEIQQDIRSTKQAKANAQINEHSFEKPYVLEQNTK